MKLYIFVEGEHDEDFFKKILNQELNRKYGELECKRYGENNFKERKLIKNIINKKQNNFIFCLDLDKNKESIKKEEVANYFDIGKVSSKKEKKQGKKLKKKKILKEEFQIEFSDIENKMYVVVQMIESWYLAGFDTNFCTKKHIEFYPDTEEITKGTFKKIARELRKDPDRIRDELIRSGKFSISEARNRNKSFDNFCQKIL